MKRYSHFLRSTATISLLVLYVGTSLFSYSSVQAEELIEESVTTEVSLEIQEEIILEETQESEIISETLISSEELVDTTTADISPEEVISEETVAFRETEVVRPLVACEVSNSPVITFSSEYADIHESTINGESEILSQINPTANDLEDGVVAVTNNFSSLAPVNPGWYEVTFTAVDTDGCVTTKIAQVFIVGDSFTPSCESGFIYAKIIFPETLTTTLGTNTNVSSGEWFPVMYDGLAFSESETDITTNPDISITRVGMTLFINVAPGVTDGDIVANDIADSIVFVGGSATSLLVFSGDVAVIDFQVEDCPVFVCTPSDGPAVTSVVTETVTLDENTSLTADEILALFGIVTEDLDGEGTVTLTSNLSSFSFTSEGVYTFTITLTDNEGCELSRTLTLVVEGNDDDNNGGGGGGSGGGGKTGTKKKPEGEVLGTSVCTPYLTTYMQMGQPNLKEDVVRLQTFLNEYMGENLKVDGVYGQATFEAVKRFQTQEFDEILKPWGITEPTGITRETTMRRINNIMCPELNIQMPILYCATTGNLIYPDGKIVDPNPEYILYNGQPVVRKQVIIPEVLSEILIKETEDNYSWTPAPVINPETGRIYEK